MEPQSGIRVILGRKTFYMYPRLLYYNFSVVELEPGIGVRIFYEVFAYYFGGEKLQALGLQT